MLGFSTKNPKSSKIPAAKCRNNKLKSFLLGEKKIVIFYGFHASNKVRVWYLKAATEAVLAEASKVVERLFFLQLANLQRGVH